MTTAPDKAQILSALKFEWETIEDLCLSLGDADWETETECPGWSVKDNLSHIIGTELLLSGVPIPEIEIPDLAHLKNDIAKINERWILERRGRSGAEVLEEFRTVSKDRMEFLEGLDAKAWEAESMTPVGPAPYGRFMQIRVLDSWMHEQDIREAVGKPGNVDGSLPIEVTLDEIQLALGFVVGKLGGAPDGSRVEFEVTGASGRNIFIEVIEGRAQVVDGFDTPHNPVDVKFTCSVGTLGRLVGGRKEGAAVREAGDISIEAQAGQEDLAQNILNKLGYMI